MKNLLLIVMMMLLPFSAFAITDCDPDDAAQAKREKELQEKGINPDDPNNKCRPDGSMPNGKPLSKGVKHEHCCTAQIVDGEHNGEKPMNPDGSPVDSGAGPATGNKSTD